MKFKNKFNKASFSFKTKLLILFLLISAVPLVLAIGLNAMNMITDLEQNTIKDGELRNRIAQEKIMELYEKNFNILHVLAATPMTYDYLIASPENRDPIMESMMIKTNSILKDNNNLIITDTEGNQLIRTDGLPLVNVLQRKYFWEAMKGKESISEVVVSLATSRLISVIEVPVFSPSGQVVGLVQRDYDLSELQEYVYTLATRETYVMILDKQGKMIAHSAKMIETEEDRTDENKYDFVSKALSGESGHIYTNFEGENSLVCYSRNFITGWAVITIQPDKFFKDRIYNKAIVACIFGFCLLIFMSFVAYALTDKLTQPLIALSKAVLEIANSNSNRDAANIEKITGDELQQMAAAFNEIQNNQDELHRASEIDKLTQIYNKGTTEKICQGKLKNLAEDQIAVLYVVDLDHFKEANDTCGHHYGDLILQEFARQLKNLFPNDCVGRFGGDEFIIFIADISEEMIPLNAQKISQAARELCIETKPAGITASIGIAIAPKNSTNYNDLFNVADKALYSVKNDGRDGYCYQIPNVIHEWKD